MSTTSTYLTLYTSIILLAANGLFAKDLPLDASSMTQIRSVIAAIAIILTLIIVKRSLRLPDRKSTIGIYLLGIVMGVHWVTYFHSMQVSTIAIGMLSLFTFPVIIVFMEAAIQRVKPHAGDIISALLVLVGIGLMAANENITLSSSTFQGILWGVFSAFLFACRNLAQKYYFKHIPSDVSMLHQLIAIAILLIIFVDWNNVATLSSFVWLKLLLLGTVFTAGAHTLLVVSYKNLPAKTVAMISCMQPVIGAALAWALLGEQPTLFIIVGGAIILTVATYESVANKQ